jgi:hypothetical protein
MRKGRFTADAAEMSPLQQRLLATYMDALADQDEGAAGDATPGLQSMVLPPKPEPVAERPTQASTSRSDLYAKKMSELLLKGWKMLGENCPETGDVPLMQHPSSGRSEYLPNLCLHASGAAHALRSLTAIPSADTRLLCLRRIFHRHRSIHGRAEASC